MAHLRQIRSLRMMPQKIDEKICLNAAELNPVHEVLFNYYGLPVSEKDSCRFVFTTERFAHEQTIAESAVLGRYARPRDRDRFVLFDKGE